MARRLLVLSWTIRVESAAVVLTLLPLDVGALNGVE